MVPNTPRTLAITPLGAPVTSSPNKGTRKEQIKIRIPHPNDGPDAGVEIVGLLARADNYRASQKNESSIEPVSRTTVSKSEMRPLALILHGVFAHKDQTYHRGLVAALDIDSFRFDFRGNSESTGEWNIGAIDADYRDLLLVVEHLRTHYNYWIEIVVAHSRGAGIVWEYFAKEFHEGKSIAQRIPFYVSVSARWFPPGILGEHHL